MAHYETVLIARQDVSAAQVETIADMAQLPAVNIGAFAASPSA